MLIFKHWVSFYVYDPDGIIVQFDSGLNEG